MPKALDKELQPFLKRVENIKLEIEQIHESKASEIGELKESIREVYGEVKAKGLPVRPLKKLVAWRALERRQEALGDGLDDDDSAAFALLVEQLGPLGRAAAAKAGHDPEALDKVGRGKVETPVTH